MQKYLYILFIFISLASFRVGDYEIGQSLDQHNGVAVYYNGNNFTNVIGRNVTRDGYNLGLKFQCVEYIKRYYYKIYGHRMPNSYGNAKDLFDKELEDVAFNAERGLMQYRNIRYEKPQVGDILIYDGSRENPFGHTGIVTEVGIDHIEIIQQNTGLETRREIFLAEFQGIYTVADYDVLGWLRLP